MLLQPSAGAKRNGNQTFEVFSLDVRHSEFEVKYYLCFTYI
jgi:hypothetical protein